MAPLPDAILALIPRSLGFSTAADAPTANIEIRSSSPVAAQNLHLVARAAGHADYGAGAKPPNAFNNKGFQALFALIGVGMVITSIWFFFWAKNGGFKWQSNDWEDYKSTVMRRKGPDGKTLSNATKSTRLGGGSVVHGGSYGGAPESSVGYTDETGTSADFGEMREVEEGKGRRAFGLRGGEGEKKKNRRDHTNNYKDEDLRDYRGEKAARVGGLNRQADGVYTDYSNTEPSELGSNVSSRPLVTKPKDKKQEAKDKERRAKERMRKAKLIEKNAARTAAAEAKAQKEADKALAKKEKAEKKQEKKLKPTETEYTPSEAPVSEYPRSEAPASEYLIAKTEYTKSEAPRTEYTKSEGTRSDYSRSEAPRSEYPRLNGPSSRPPPSKSPRKSHRAPPSAAYSFVSGDDTNTVYTGTYTDNRTAPSEAAESSYYSDYRPNADPTAFSRGTRSRPERQSQPQSKSQPHSRSNSSSPRKQHRSSRQSEAPSDIFTQTNGNAQGTISYPCYIPGLSSAGSVGVSESISQVGVPTNNNRRSARGGGGRDVMDGYRRGGIRPVGRRDSLSDSDS